MEEQAFHEVSINLASNSHTGHLRGHLGMWGNSTNGHVIASSNAGLVDIDPIAGSYRVVKAGLFPDGVSVSPDGATAYVENGAIQAYDLATGTLLRSFLNFGHAPDGTGVISGGPLNGESSLTIMTARWTCWIQPSWTVIPISSSSLPPEAHAEISSHPI